MAQIVVPDNELNSFDLPRVCIITGATQNVVFKKVKFSWYPRWVGVTVLINVLVAAVLAAVLTKRVQGELPFLEEAYAAWRKGRILFAFSIVLAVGLLIGGVILLASEQPIPGAAALVATLVVPIVVWVKFLKDCNVTCTRIADGHTTLKIPSDEAAMKISSHLSGARPNRPARAAGMGF
ncbi:MAG: hypothetical protein ACYC8T_38560 [Myxococcaceae bacterium]